jgi:hypothetical protein
MTAAQILNWLDRHARQIVLQDLSPDRRQKNRVILEYQTPGSTELEVVGSQSLASAVCRAQTRIDAKEGKA